MVYSDFSLEMIVEQCELQLQDIVLFPAPKPVDVSAGL